MNSGDFNVSENEYNYSAIGQQRDDFGSLSNEAYDYYSLIKNNVIQSIENDDRNAYGAYSCIQKLCSFLLFEKRLARHAARLYELEPAPGELIGANGVMDEICIDFEALLYFGRATLDRLTLFVSRCYGQNSDRFSSLPNILSNFESKDNKAVQAQTLLNSSLPIFNKLIINEDQTKSLRSSLIHRRSLGELLVTTYTAICLENRKILRFDFELDHHPVIYSVQSLAKHVTFVVLNMLGIYMETTMNSNSSNFNVTWENKTVVFSKYIDPTNQGPRFSVVKMLPDGFEVITKHLKPSVINNALSPSKAS